MGVGLVGRKLGMSQVFDQEGNLIPVTVLHLGPNRVVQVKRSGGQDGYDAIKVGYTDCDPRKLNRPELGVFRNANLEPMRHLREFRVHGDEAQGFTVGDELKVTMFMAGENLDVTGTSKGKGFQGVVKRHGFKGAKEQSHGTHEYKRHGGSIGCSAYPGRVVKGKKMAGQMGNVRITTRALRIVAVIEADNLLLVKGAVPGPRNGLVIAKPSGKQPAYL